MEMSNEADCDRVGVVIVELEIWVSSVKNDELNSEVACCTNVVGENVKVVVESLELVLEPAVGATDADDGSGNWRFASTLVL